MKINLFFMKSRVAKRIFSIFLICALLPIGILAFISLHQLSEDQKDKSFLKLHQASKNIGMSVLEGLSFIQSEMHVVALSNNAGLQTPVLELLNQQSGDRHPRLLGLTLFEGQKAIKTLLGKPCPYPKVTASDLQYLSTGEGVLYIQRLNKYAYRMFMIVGINMSPHRERLLVGEVNTEYLWEIARSSLPSMTDMYIRTSSGISLYNTSPLSQVALKEIENKMKTSAVGRLEWTDEAGTHFASQWSAFLKGSIYADDWKIIVSESKGDAFAAVNRVSKMMALILIVFFLAILFLSSVQIRRNLEPLARLKEGTQRVSQGDFKSLISVRSGDEFEELAASFNTMSTRIGKHFTNLSDMGQMITDILTSLDKERIIHTVLLNASKVVSCGSVSLTLIDLQEPITTLTFLKSSEYGDTASIVKRHTNFQLLELRKISEARENLLVESAEEFDGLLSTMKERGCIKFVLLPINIRNRLAGVLTLGYMKQPEQIREDCVKARQIADHVASALANAGLIEELDQLNWGTLTALARAVDASSSWTAGHSERVTNLSLQIAHAMGMNPEELQIFHRGALLHDIGKIGIPSSILNKISMLTADEYNLIKEHPEKGALILEPIKAYDKVIPIVVQHHEWFNGQGYPKGLSGAGICIGARILAVADVYDALLSDRPYRKGWDKDVVIAHIHENSGLQFDPEVVRAFSKIINMSHSDTMTHTGMTDRHLIPMKDRN
jgi:putative nucleotidyltransferase with HDIG domain